MENTKQEKRATISIKLEWIIWGILILLTSVSVLTRGFTRLPFNLGNTFLNNILGEAEMDKEEVKEKVAKYINEELLQGQRTVEIIDITEDEDDDLYKIKISLDGQEFDSYVSKDGKYLYTERMEIVTKEDIADYPKSDTPDILLFTMSFCPYGNQAEDFVRPVNDLLKDRVNFEPHYVIYSSAQGYEGKEYCLDDENKYCSMHGVGELNQDVRELCVFKYQQALFWDFVMAINEKCDASNVDECWEQVAKDLMIDTGKIKSCQANEAIAFLEEEVRLTEQYNVTGSPSILINEKNYEGDRAPESFKKAVCAGFNNEPGECSQTLDETTDAAGGSCN